MAINKTTDKKEEFNNGTTNDNDTNANNQTEDSENFQVVQPIFEVQTNTLGTVNINNFYTKKELFEYLDKNLSNPSTFTFSIIKRLAIIQSFGEEQK